MGIRDDLRLKFACEENWDTMAVDGKGRHCATCNRRVHDLDRMSDAEIRAAFRKSGGAICGRFTGLAFSALLTVIQPAATAQSPPPVTAEKNEWIVRGVVADPTGAVIPNAQVTVSKGRIKKRTASGADGQFRLAMPVSGPYEIRVEAEGFLRAKLKKVDTDERPLHVKLAVGPLTMGVLIVSR